MAGMEGQRPTRKEAAFQAGPPGGTPPGGEARSQGRPISFRDELSLWTREKLGSNPPLKLWAALDAVETSTIRLYGDAASQETAWKVKWAYYAVAFPLLKEKDLQGEPYPAWMSGTPALYNQLKDEQRKRGEDQPFLDLNREQGETLQWALELAGVPFNAQVDEKGMMRVSLTPLEQEVAGVQFANTRKRQDGDQTALRRPSRMPERKQASGQIIDLTTKRNERTHRK